MGVKATSERYVKLLGYLVLVVLINIVGMTLFLRVDLTKDRIYSISEASRRVVSTLSEPLTINVFFTKNLPAPYNNTERYLHDLLGEYAHYANKYFNYRFYDVSPEEGDISKKARENQVLARNYGIYPVQIQAIEKDEVKFQNAYMGLVLIHGDLIERIPTITSIEGLEYKLTMAIQKLNNKVSALLGLKEKIRIKLFLSSSLERVAPYMRLKNLSELPVKLEGTVRKLSEKHYGKLEFEYLDPSKDQGLNEIVKKYNIMNLRWPALSGGEVEPGEGAIGLLMQYGERTISIPLIRVLRLPLIGTQYELTDMQAMEEIISQNLESLIDINEDLGVLAGHGALDLFGPSPLNPMGQRKSDDLENFRTLISQNYTIKQVDLKKDDPIPRSFNCLVIAGPTEKFSDYELFQIDQFLMSGKNLAIFLDRFKEEVPSDQGAPAPGGGHQHRIVPLDTGLEELLKYYGIRIRDSYVMDESSYKQRIPTRLGGGERPIYFAPLIKSETINNDPKFMKPIKGLVVFKISPLEVEMKRAEEMGLKVTRLFSSSERSWEMAGQIHLNPMLIRPPQSAEEFKSLPLAYILEGRFVSYFAGKPLPEKSTDKPEAKGEGSAGPAEKKSDVDLSKIEGGSQFLTKGGWGKIFLIGSSEVLKNNMLDAEGKTPNAMFITNIIDYLNNREDIAVMRSKEQRFNPLVETGGRAKTFIKSFNIAGLPVLVVLFGLGVWFRRHSRKKRIQIMFKG
jgi:ABC-2 type transport system permease protein